MLSSEKECVEYINKILPTLDSFEQNVDGTLRKLHSDLLILNKEISMHIKKQSDFEEHSKKALVEIKNSIIEINQRITSIKNKSEEIEILQNVKSLDNGKKNLQLTIDCLERLFEVETCLEKKELKDCDITTLYTNYCFFEKYCNIPRINTLLKRMELIILEFRNKLEKEFKVSLKYNPVFDTLDEIFKQKITSIFTNTRINKYKLEFTEKYPLEQINLRYNWLHKHLRIKSFNFPKSWNIEQELAIDFCIETRAQMERTLLTETNGKTISQALKQTVSFEKIMQLKYHKNNDNKKNYNFNEIISKAFEKYIHLCIAFEDKNMNEIINKQNDHWEMAKDIFLFISISIENIIAYNKGKILFEFVNNVYKKNLRKYGDFLRSQLKEGKNIMRCAIYCENNITLLENEVRGIIENDYKGLIDFKAEKEQFLNLNKC